MSFGWLAIDLDGTLAFYEKWQRWNHIGEPIPAMVDKIKKYMKDNPDIEVRIFTARVCDLERRSDIIELIQDYTEAHLGKRLMVTNEKDYGMIDLWDDRCRRVIANTGEFCCGAID